MNYISTRGETQPVGFSEAVIAGLARDGGLYLPATLPDTRDRFDEWAALSYTDLAFEIMRLFTDLPDADLRPLILRSYASFRHADVTPVVTKNNVHIVELFHGPTLAFKDVALQFLGNLFEYLLDRSGRPLNILAATSGDTGSAAIHGVRGRRNMTIFVMFPHGRISPIQERQMTTVLDDNVNAIAVEGSFDDCQRIMKTIFNRLDFKDRYALGSVNSINWARLLAQIIYYFYAAFRVMKSRHAAQVRFAVPTGNFGDIFAGYLAFRMGLPIRQLVLATNENDILARFFQTGIYSRGQVHATISPSMDIQVASNFERYLFYRAGEKPDLLRAWMNEFAATGRIRLDPLPDGRVDPLFVAGASDTAATLATIRRFHDRYGYLLDPHTAVGVDVAERFMNPDEPMICLATAHPAKFGDTIRQATGRDLARHEFLDRLPQMPTRCVVLPASDEAVRNFIERRLAERSHH